MRLNRSLSVSAIALALASSSCAHGTDEGLPGAPFGQGGSGNADGFDPNAESLPPTTNSLPLTPYAAGAILPSGERAALNAAMLEAFNAWKKRYVVEGCEGIYVDLSRDPVTTDRRTIPAVTNSEVHGMAMLATALLAERDLDAHRIFDGLYAYYRAHPSAGSPDLMASAQVAGCVNATEGTFSSTDADLDIAYALLAADKAWGSTGAIDYASEARRVMAAIQTHDIDPTTRLPLLGDWVVAGVRREGQAARTSHFLIDHVRVFNGVTSEPFWSLTVDAQWATIKQLQDAYSPSTGLLPDFVTSTHTSPEPSPSNWFEGITDPWFAANASRVPFRLGVDWLVSGDERAQTALQRMNDWIRTKTGDDANNISAGYRLDGSLITTYVFSDTAFVAPFGVAAMCNVKNQAWLDSVWTRLRTTSVDTESAPSATIRVLSMIVMSGHWLVPIPSASKGP